MHKKDWLDEEGGEAGEPACDGDADGERDDEHDAVGQDLGVGHHQVRVSQDCLAYTITSIFPRLEADKCEDRQSLDFDFDKHRTMTFLIYIHQQYYKLEHWIRPRF